MLGSIAIAMMLASPEGALQVDVGRANWATLPPLRAVERVLPSSGMVKHVETILKKRVCRIPGQTWRRFDITVPYAVLVEPNGSATRVLVAEIGCPELETFVGYLVTAMADAGDFQPNSEPKARWFASELNFNLQ